MNAEVVRSINAVSGGLLLLALLVGSALTWRTLKPSAKLFTFGLAAYITYGVGAAIVALDHDTELTWVAFIPPIANIWLLVAIFAITLEKGSEPEGWAAKRKRRRDEDTLRSDDRLAQGLERADSRAMYDAEHLGEPPADRTHRTGMRELEDDNRAHSHELQDSERDATRLSEDRATLEGQDPNAPNAG